MLTADQSAALDRLTADLRQRIENAASHGERLAGLIAGWMKTEPVNIKGVIADDRLSWEVRAEVSDLPFASWASAFGDSVHNLRSALDHLAWGIAVLDGVQPSKPKAIQFPIVEKRGDWANERKRISELPSAAQVAIEAIQPFQRTGPDDGPLKDPLLLLHRLSNIDKHRFAIQPTITPTQLSHSFAVEFGSDEEAAMNVPPDVTISTDILVDGTTLLRQVTKTPITKVIGGYAFEGEIVVIDSVCGPLGVTKVLADLITYVPQVLDHVILSMRAVEYCRHPG